MALLVGGPALAQERHVAKGKHVPVYEEGQALEQKGDEYLDGGKKEKAEESFKQAIARYQQVLILKEDFLEVYGRLSRVLGVLHQYRQAAAVLKRGLTHYPNNTELREQLAMHLVLAGYVREGIPLLEKVAAERPGNVAVQAILADYYRDADQPAKAIVVLERILNERPRAYNRRIELGRALLQLKRLSEALVALRSVPADAGAFYAAAQVGTGDVFMLAGKPQGALQTYTQVERTLKQNDPLATELILKIADSLRALGRYDDALKRYATFVSKAPADSRGYFGAGEAHRLVGRPKQAIAQQQAALRLYSRSPRIYEALARAYLDVGEAGSAVAAQRQAVRLAPGDWRYQSDLGLINRRLGDVKQALALHRQLSEPRPWSAELFAQVGHDLYYLGQFAEAEQAYERALKRERQHDTARRGITMVGLQRAHGLIRAGKLDEAQVELKRLLTYEALPSRIQVMLASIAVAQEKPQEAQTWLDQTTPADRNGWLYQLLRGRALLQQGKSEAALAVLRAIRRVKLTRPQVDALDLATAAAEVGAGEYDSAVARLRSLTVGPVGDEVRRLSATAFVLRAEKRWREENAQATLDDIGSALQLREHLSPADQKRANLLHALAAAALEQKQQAVAALAAFDRQKSPAESEILSSQYGSRAGQGMLRAFIYYRVGEYDRALKLLAPLAQGGAGADAAKVALLYQGVLRGQAYRLFLGGNYRGAAKAAKDLGRVVPKPDLQDKLLFASVDYQLGQHDQALAAFEELAKQMPEAELNVGIYFDDVKHDKRAAYDRYVSYVRRAGAHAQPRAVEWVKVKQRIFGFQ